MASRHLQTIMFGVAILSLAVAVGAWRTANRVSTEQIRRTDKVDRIDRIEQQAIDNNNRLNDLLPFQTEVARQMNEKTRDRIHGTEVINFRDDLQKRNPQLDVPDIKAEDSMPKIKPPEKR